jgi:hypothetical protein
MGCPSKHIYTYKLNTTELELDAKLNKGMVILINQHFTYIKTI